MHAGTVGGCGLGLSLPVSRGRGRAGLVDPMRLDPTGADGPTPAQARGRCVATVESRLCTCRQTSTRACAEQRIVEAAAVLPAYGGVTGWAALRWLGASWMTGLAPDGQTPLPVVLVTAGDDIRPQPGIQVSAERLNPAELTVHDGLQGDGRGAVDVVRDAVRRLGACRRRGGRHGDAGRSRVAGRDAVVRRDASRAGPACRNAARRWRSPTRTAGHRGRPATCGWSGSSTPASPGRAATCRSSTAPVGTSAPPTFSTRRPASSASTTGRCTCRVSSGGATYAARRRSVPSVWSTSRSSRRMRATPSVVVRRMLATRARARFAAESARAWTLEKPPVVDPHRDGRPAPGSHGRAASAAVPQPRRLSVLSG